MHSEVYLSFQTVLKPVCMCPRARVFQTFHLNQCRHVLRRQETIPGAYSQPGCLHAQPIVVQTLNPRAPKAAQLRLFYMKKSYSTYAAPALATYLNIQVYLTLNGI